mmetsp:Transcript_117714/g.327825  ORF Transcript_117714/g.327825 Transcript_117714/m.327825 type:complete len:363 (+) Transcript_117714:34-1122(+)
MCTELCIAADPSMPSPEAAVEPASVVSASTSRAACSLPLRARISSIRRPISSLVSSRRQRACCAGPAGNCSGATELAGCSCSVPLAGGAAGTGAGRAAEAGVGAGDAAGAAACAGAGAVAATGAGAGVSPAAGGVASAGRGTAAAVPRRSPPGAKAAPPGCCSSSCRRLCDAAPPPASAGRAAGNAGGARAASAGAWASMGGRPAEDRVVQRRSACAAAWFSAARACVRASAADRRFMSSSISSRARDTARFRAWFSPSRQAVSSRPSAMSHWGLSSVSGLPPRSAAAPVPIAFVATMAAGAELGDLTLQPATEANDAGDWTPLGCAPSPGEQSAKALRLVSMRRRLSISKATKRSRAACSC